MIAREISSLIFFPSEVVLFFPLFLHAQKHVFTQQRHCSSHALSGIGVDNVY